MKKNDHMIELGFCRKPHGIKGGFTFSLFNSEESVIQKGSKLYLYPEGPASSLSKKGGLFHVSKISFGNKVIVYLDEVDSRNAVEEMIPFSIKVPRDSFPSLDESEIYLVDLIDLKVIDYETKKEIGKIEGHYDNTAQIILKISGGIEIPFLDQFVPVVNVEEGFIEVIVPEVV